MGSTKKKTENPLDSTMSLGDHLEELRARLMLAMIGLVIGAVACLLLGKKIIHFIERPYLSVVQSKSSDSEEREVEADPNDLVTAFCANLVEALASDPNAPAIDPNAVTFIQTVYTATVAAWADDPNAKPKVETTKSKADSAGVGTRLQTLAPSDGFVSYMKISLVAGLIISSPWVFYQLWMFVAAGLYSNERRYVNVAVPFSAALFVIGALFFLLVVAPLALRFLIGFNTRFLGVNSHFTFQNYISFVTMLMLVFGIAFQTPIAIFVLVKTGLVSVRALRRSRKYVLLGIFVVAAMATPPDVISQVTLAIPLYFLFELGIVLGYFATRKKKKKSEEGPPSETDVY
ncbi:MAG: twin-arginine translocase subunit TatC [Planctomycetes bacterium]|nr:twin-arginine translocase subunit TatC [Planctomycetota bacterium]MBL7153227.1 twin-arginine translocase subunit TatC [Phycisphaerae bacterium]